MKGYVYILLMGSGKYYVGSTKNIERRLLEHKAGKVLSTKYFLPVECLHIRGYTTYSLARKKEIWLKKQKSRDSIEQFIAGN